MIADSLTIVIVLAVIVEIVTNVFKTIFPLLKGSRSRIVAAFVGIIICISTNTGILYQLDIDITLRLIDYILTGIVISRGSNAIHDLISIFDRQNQKLV
ncbi:MAG: hypothetical protein ACOCQ2_00060 [Halanaerobiales bacterium]